MKSRFQETIFLQVFFVISFFTLSCSQKEVSQKSIAVFVPGVIADSPIYEMLVHGVKTGVTSFNKEHKKNVSLTIMEAGTNQAEWSTKLISLASEAKYDLIISSNPSLPDLVEPITSQFPNQKFILLDAFKEGNPNIYTARYNQHEQAYLTGCMAALMSTTKKIGLIAAQEYPVMNNVILPGYEEGAKSIDKNITVDFRIVGNWYDATKGSELATAMKNSNVDVILPICGGASQGVISSAKEHNIFLTFFDGAHYFSRAPQHIVSCTILEQSSMAEEVTRSYLLDNIDWGSAITVGVKEGYIKFITEDGEKPNTIVSQNVKNKMQQIVKQIEEGTIYLPQVD